MKSYFPKILLTGANGQIGLALKFHPLITQYTLIPYTHTQLDISNLDSIKAIILKSQPDLVINAAAYTSVDGAEKEKKEAMLTNYEGAKNIAIACQEAQVPLIHISTNYVFDGRKHSGYTEEDTPCPINVYGESKYLGEEAVRNHCEKHIILRVSSLFGEYGRNFLKTFLNLAMERKEVNLVADQISCPTYTGNIAETLLRIAKCPEHFGTYHYCNQTPASWYTFADVILQETSIYNIPFRLERLNPISSISFPTPAIRPLRAALDNTKILTTYPVKEYTWRNSLHQIIEPLARSLV